MTERERLFSELATALCRRVDDWLYERVDEELAEMAEGACCNIERPPMNGPLCSVCLEVTCECKPVIRYGIARRIDGMFGTYEWRFEEFAEHGTPDLAYDIEETLHAALSNLAT